MKNKKKNNIQTVSDSDFQIINSDYEFNYQKELTIKLDNIEQEFDQK